MKAKKVLIRRDQCPVVQKKRFKDVMEAKECIKTLRYRRVTSLSRPIPNSYFECTTCSGVHLCVNFDKHLESSR